MNRSRIHIEQVTRRYNHHGVASDPQLAKSLGFREAFDLLRSIPDSEKGSELVRTPGGEQRVGYLTEAGFYRALGQHGTPQTPKRIAMTDISTREGLAAYRATAFTKPEPPAVEAMSVSIHMRVEPGHEIEGREIRTALWSRLTYVDDFEPSVSLHYDDGGAIPHDENPDPLPEWVPRPPAAWLALAAEMLAEVA